MKRTRICSHSLALLSLFVGFGCTHAGQPATQPTMEPAAAEQPASHGAAPELIEVRLLVVAYKGAQGASPEQERSKEQALERARMLSTMARGSDQLIELLPKYGDGSGPTENHGAYKLRPAQPAPFAPAVAQAGAALPIGGISDPVETPEGYVVIERLKDPPAGPERIAARHILIGYAGSPQAIAGATRSEAEARALAEQIVKEARAPGADWNALAAKYTDEPGSKKTGGDLHLFGRGQMVPAFEQAAFALKVGEISDVVQSPFGFHVIQRYQ